MKRIVFTVLLAVIVLLAAAGAGVWFIFRKEISIVRSIHRYGDKMVFYTMEYKDGYYLDEMLDMNISSETELITVLKKIISHGMFEMPETPEMPDKSFMCSTLTCVNEKRHILWGRNFDWIDSVPIIVKSTPKNGYASISTCDFYNMIRKANVRPEGSNALLALTAYYIPMDGVNEKGLCVADLEVQNSVHEVVDTEKKNITMTMAIRMILDKAATVDEALQLLDQYDIYPSAGITTHLSISDRSGKAVAVEIVNGKMLVTPTCSVTNFAFYKGDISGGGESAKYRFLVLLEAYMKSHGVMSAAELTKAMQNASQKEKGWQTMWTLIYEYSGEKKDPIQLTYYWACDYRNAWKIDLSMKPEHIADIQIDSDQIKLPEQ